MIFPNLKKYIAFSLCAVMLFCYAAAEDESFMERHFAAPSGFDATIALPDGRELAYYAQNDELWGSMIYEEKSSAKRRPFRDSGCAPTALAIALRRVVPDEDLILLSRYAKRPYSLCPCSLNEGRCTSQHVRYYLTSVKDYRRFLPLILGDFACGNNVFGVVDRDEGTGTGVRFYKSIAGIFDLDMTTTTDIEQAAIAANMGMGVVVFAGSGGAFTSTGHYMSLVGADDEYYYIFDPLCRSSYKTWDSQGIVNVIYQGLVSFKKSKLHYANFYSFVIFSPRGK